MDTLKDQEYEDLIQGYLEGQFQEWFSLEIKIYR